MVMNILTKQSRFCGGAAQTLMRAHNLILNCSMIFAVKHVLDLVVEAGPHAGLLQHLGSGCQSLLDRPCPSWPDWKWFIKYCYLQKKLSNITSIQDIFISNSDLTTSIVSPSVTILQIGYYQLYNSPIITNCHQMRRWENASHLRTSSPTCRTPPLASQQWWWAPGAAACLPISRCNWGSWHHACIFLTSL